MNVTTERHSLFRLWLESFAVVNRSVGKLLGLVLVSILVVGLLMWGILASLG